ncbi:helix-turn-helix domain-containing protein [Actinophytocola gossypii]|uniref:Tetratricopeptide repeat protein n=1 Tax=Actinophytocola gossypii TaxID=2812003 RepID=A0ABT2J5R3_9PSEU|nr:helix-turn-helix domain-containing protein [Actinophytocola gossypii]MCT2583197.1 tetratricopeptide repeat protein [Actinophytocola gossypii]
MQDRRDDGTSPFADELERLLRKRGLSWRRLSDLIGYTPSWLSKIKHGAPPSAELARKCDQVLEADGQLIALAAASGGGPVRLAQLPAAAATFVGRDAELRELSQILSGESEPGIPHTVAIDGPPGAGKTALALRVAHAVVDRYSDGQLYVDLRGYSPDGQPRIVDEVLEEFLTALGVQIDVIPAGLEARAKLFRSVLADRRVMVVLDNAADSSQLHHLMPGSAGCAVVVTSRKRLGGLTIRGDRRITLGPMTEDESVTLLRKVIGSERAEAEPDAVRALANRCGNLPLALRIAAERVATHPHHAVSLLVEELATEDERLEALSTDDSVAVKTVFSWSYRDLPADAARMFRLIGLHVGSHVSTGAAAALADQRLSKARRLLDRLAGVHLIEGLGSDRYRMHDLLRVYAAEQAVEEEPETERVTALRRMVDWYLQNAYAANHTLAPQRHDPELEKSEFSVEVADFDYGSALEWCEIEMSNIAMATRTAVEVGENVAAWKLPAGSFNYLQLRKRWTPWVASHEIGVTGARRAGDRYGEAWVLNNLAIAYRDLRRTEEAKRCFQQARALRIEVGDRVGQAWSLIGIGYIGFDQQRFDDAALHFGEALDIFREVGDRHGEGIALANVGDAYRCLGWFDRAVEALEQALELFRDIEDRYGQCYTLVKLGDTYSELRRAADALDCFRRALDTRRELGDRWGEGETLHKLGLLLYDNGQPEKAAESLRKAVEIFDELGDPRAVDLRELLSGRS